MSLPCSAFRTVINPLLPLLCFLNKLLSDGGVSLKIFLRVYVSQNVMALISQKLLFCMFYRPDGWVADFIEILLKNTPHKITISL